MAQLTFTMKDENFEKGLDAVAIATGWNEESSDISKEQNFKRWIKTKIRNEILEQSNREALSTVASTEKALWAGETDMEEEPTPQEPVDDPGL